MTAQTLDKYKIKKYRCFNCPLGCGAEYRVNNGRWPLGQTERPEYETAAAFGSNILCDEEDALFKANEICNRYGLDTISTGMTIAWAMECYNEGVLSKKELDGIDLGWGNGAAVIALLEKMARVEGCGAILCNGSAYAAKTWGKGGIYLQTASGIELPMHDPRLGPGLARTYQYDPTPGRHVKGGLGMGQLGLPPDKKYIYVGTGKADLLATLHQEVINCAGFCTFITGVGVKPRIIFDYIEAITGLPFSDEDSFNTGLRILNLRQAFNLREGITPAACTISARAVGKPPLSEGPLANVIVDNDQLGKNFFLAADWNIETGKPSQESLRKIGHLDEVIVDLYGIDELN